MILIRNYLLFFFFLFVGTIGYSQANVIVTYMHELPKLEYSTDYLLIINNQLSHFQHHQEAEGYTTPQGYELEFSKNYYDWYYDASQKKITEQRVLKDGTRVIAHWEANLEWTITEETKKISGYNVQKATTRSHDLTGRPSEWDYGDAIAWFTTDIPISSGPARYYGLPGLIIYLEFSGRSDTYALKDIKWDANETIIIPTDGIEVTKEQTFRHFALLTKKWLKEQKKSRIEK